MLVLASASPRRAEILRAAGIAFSTRPSHVDETRKAGEGPDAYVRRLAESKARAAVATPGEIVLAADTTVYAGGQILEKPTDTADAIRMLTLLSGRAHQVLTGICLRRGASVLVDAAVTVVHFLPMSAADIVAYAASGEPMDKAGAYAIQGLASKFIHRVEGCYFNVVGLPVSLVWQRLGEFTGSLSETSCASS